MNVSRLVGLSLSALPIPVLGSLTTPPGTLLGGTTVATRGTAAAIADSDHQPSGDNFITLQFAETVEAFPNPMKGFRPSRYPWDTRFPKSDFATVFKHYIPYTELEESPDDDVQKIVTYSNTAWAGLEKQNQKVIPRVVISYDAGHQYWASGLLQSTDPRVKWDNPVFLGRLTRLVQKLGKAWDGDPRVAAVEMGLWGNYGEHNIYHFPDLVTDDRIPPSVQAVLGQAFRDAFPNKKVMVRNADRFLNFDVGSYWDSFALPEDRASGDAIVARAAWRTEYVTGEVAYDWGSYVSTYGRNPDATLASDAFTDVILGAVATTHCSSLGWISDYTPSSATKKNAERLQKSLGYHYVLRQATFPTVAHKGDWLGVTLMVDNTGSAGFYYPWPVALFLLDEARRVVTCDVVETDIRTWLPGDTISAGGFIKIPETYLGRELTLAAGILDPAGRRPCIRFSNTNYFNGGLMPLGRVSLDGNLPSQDLGTFDSLFGDHSLSYELP